MFDRLFNTFKSAISPQSNVTIPRLYPDIEDPKFALFRTPAQSAEIKKYPLVMVLPFVDEPSSQDEKLFGAGFARLLIRNLMLARKICVKGPEDTPDAGLNDVRRHLDSFKQHILIGGKIVFGNGFIQADVTFLTPNGKSVDKSFRARDGRNLLWQCSEQISKILRAEVDDGIREMWKYGQPNTNYEQSVMQLGFVQMAYDIQDPQRSKQAVALLNSVPSLSVCCAYIDDDCTPDAARLFLRSYEYDPYDPQLCFGLFTATWQSTGHEPYSLQFIRRGLELSPGHGKLNMCAPHTAHPSVTRQMLHFSELGYRLLPGNSFAINNYLINLHESGAPTRVFFDLANEGLAADPYDPGCCQRLLDIFQEQGQYTAALKIAMKLEGMYRTMHPRTRYCIQQNPQRAEMLANGYDFTANMRETIQELRAKL